MVKIAVILVILATILLGYIIVTEIKLKRKNKLDLVLAIGLCCAAWFVVFAMVVAI